MRDHQPVVVLPLRRRWRPRLARVEQHRDRVLVPVDVARFEPDDERHRDSIGGRRRGDSVGGRRVVRVVGLERTSAGVRVGAGQGGALGWSALRQVQEPVRGRLVALGVLRTGLARPRLDLRAGEDGPAARMVGHYQPCRASAPDTRDERDASQAQPANHALQTPAARRLQHARDVAAPCPQPQARRPHAARQGHAHEHVTAGHEVRPIGQHLDARRRHARIGRSRGDRSHQRSGTCRQRERTQRTSWVQPIPRHAATTCTGRRGPPRQQAGAAPLRTWGWTGSSGAGGGSSDWLSENGG